MILIQCYYLVSNMAVTNLISSGNDEESLSTWDVIGWATRSPRSCHTRTIGLCPKVQLFTNKPTAKKGQNWFEVTVWVSATR